MTTKNTTKPSKMASAKATTKAKPNATPTSEAQTLVPDSSVPHTPTPVLAKTTPEAATTKTKAAKAIKPAKPKRVSALDAAAQVLASAGKPLNSQDLITAMKEQKLWDSPNGKTPHATLHAAISTHIKKKGNESRFRKSRTG